MATVNGKHYIGQSLDFEHRKKTHLRAKKNTYFHKAIRKYNYQVGFTILEKDVPLHLLNETERRWIRFYNTFEGEGYNLTDGGGNGRKQPQSPEFIERKRQWCNTPEHKEKMRQINLGRKQFFSPEIIEKIRQANLGKKHTDETKEKLRQAHLGKKLSKEHKEKIRQANLGKPKRKHISRPAKDQINLF